VVKELIGALELGPPRAWHPPVIETIATEGVGIAELSEAVNAHRSHLVESGERELRRRNRVRGEVESAVRARLRRTTGSGDAVPAAIIDRVLSRRLDPWAAAGEVRL
jgi:LAO/AO transport system kinase